MMGFSSMVGMVEVLIGVDLGFAQQVCIFNIWVLCVMIDVDLGFTQQVCFFNIWVLCVFCIVFDWG